MIRSAALCAVILACGASSAEEVAAPLPSPSRSEALGRSRYRDTFVLDATTERIQLTRSGILWGSERVTRDGVLMIVGRDYTLDSPAGVLRLTKPGLRGSVIQASFAAPILLAPTVPAPTPGPAERTALERRLRTALAGPTVDAPVPDGDLASSPSPALQDELLSGLRLTQHQDILTGNGRDTGTVNYFRADPLSPQNTGEGREEFTSNLDLHPSSTSRLRLLNAFSRESLFSEDYEEIERRRLQFDQMLGKSTASLLWERRRSDGRGVANSLDALSLTLAHPFSRNTAAEGYFSFEESLYRGRETESLLNVRQRIGELLQTQAGVQFRTSEFSGSTLETGLTVVAQPRNATDLTFALRQADSDRYGRYQRLSADLNAALTRKLQLVGELSRRTSEQYGAIDTFGLGLAARPTTTSLLEAAFSESTGEALGRERTGTVRVAVDPSDRLKVQLGYDQTRSSEDGASRNGLWIVTIGGQRYLKFEGYAAQHDPNDAARYNDSLYRAELRPVEPLSLSAHLRRVLLEQDDRAVAGVGASLRLWRTLEVSTTYRRPAIDGRLVPNIAGQDVALSLTPAARFRLFGQYSVRPEDQYGVLLDQIHRSLGLETSLGSLALTGSVTNMQGTLVSDPGRRYDLLATLTLGQATRLYGGYRIEDPISLDQQRTRIYRLGVSQSAGAAFLLLEGQFGWMIDAAGARSWSIDDARAQARVGLRF